MEVVHVVSCCIIFLLTVTASPEIPSKGKHMHMGDKSHTSLEDGDFPRFAEPVANVTVSVGRDALLACVVENLKGYKVAWVRVDTQTILSIHHNVISQNNRISLTYNDHRSWYLHIKEVEESDRGWYMCQVNTDPMRSRKGYLQVVVPPMIVEGMTSNDLVVREGLNVTLMCKARGYPEPYVMWRREDGEEMLIGGEHVNVVDGELLHITKVSRLHMAAYLCVASNGVPPSISKRVHLRVQFPPMLSIPNQLEGAYVGQDVILECHTEAYPASINYWTTERGDMIISDTSRAGDKYETTSTVNGYTKYMKLKIRNVGPNDFGTYRCVAKNSLGETDGNIKLDEMPAPTTAILSEMAMLNRSLDGKRRNKNKLDSNSLPDYGVEEWRDGAGNAGDNNQAPMRNPPDAFHNSAGALAQHNLVGIIIQAIKMQSLGIFKRLTNFVQTINDNEILENIEEAMATILMKTTIPRADVHKMRKYFFATRRAVVKEWIKSTVSKWRRQQRQQEQQQEQQQQLPQLGYKTFAKTRKLCKNLIKENQDQEDTDENEYKTFKHFSTQETHVSRCDNKHGNIQSRKLSTSPHHLFQTNNQTKKFLRHAKKANEGNGNANITPANKNLFIEHFYVSSRFENHIKQQEILYKFNNLYVTANKFKSNTPTSCSCSGHGSIKLFANFIYWLIILPLSIFALSLVVNLLPKTLMKRFKRIRFHSCYTHNLMLQWLKAYVTSIWWHIVYMANNMVKILTTVYTKFSLNLNSTHSTTLQTTSAAKTATAAASTSTSAVSAVLIKTPSSLSSSLSTQSLITTATIITSTTSSSCSPTLSSSPSSSSSSLSSSQVTASALPCSTLLFCR